MVDNFESKRHGTLAAVSAYKLLRASYELEGEERDEKLEQVEDILDTLEGGWGELAVSLTNVMTFMLLDDDWEDRLDSICMKLMRYEEIQ